MFLYLVKQGKPLFKKKKKKSGYVREFFLVPSVTAALFPFAVWAGLFPKCNVLKYLISPPRFFLIYLWPFHSENAIQCYSHLTILNSINLITHKIAPGWANSKNGQLAVLHSEWIPADSTRLRQLRKWWKHAGMQLSVCLRVFFAWKFHFNLFLFNLWLEFVRLHEPPV